jgi:EamA domain-containing membrane protein RarD
MSIERGIAFRRFAFVLYGVVYGYIGVTAKVLNVTLDGTRVLTYLTVSSVLVVLALVATARRFGRET